MRSFTQPTVSRALRGHPSVNPETRRRILAIARELIYKVDKNATHLRALRTDLITKVREAVPDVILNGHPDHRLPGNAHFSFPGCEGDALLMLLDAKGIECSTGSACTAGVARPSHVLTAMGAESASARGSLRLSLGHTSTDGDVDAALAVLPAAVERARQAAVAGAGDRSGAGRP